MNALLKLPLPVSRALPGVHLTIPADAHTLAGFRAWAASGCVPEKARLTFIRGRIDIDMSGEELTSHNLVKFGLTLDLGNLSRELGLGQVFPDGCQISNEAAELTAIPDLVYITEATLAAGRVRLEPRTNVVGQFIEVIGTPDMVAEVVSDSSVRKDTVELRAAYAAAGIPEYWLIDARGSAIDFTLLRLGKRGYTATRPRDGWYRSAVWQCRVRLTRTRGRLGLWDYRLETTGVS